MASLDPVAYLRQTPPFHALPGPLFDEAARGLDVSYQPTGTTLARVGQEPLRHLWVIRKGAVRLERDGQTLQVLEEGETFGYTSLLTGKATIDVAVEEDLVAYRIPEKAFRLLLSDAPFARHFAVGLSERLRASLEHSPVATFPSDLSLEVAHLVRREAVWVAEDTTIEQAARVMRENRISSVLVRCEPPGIVTDRDLRNKVLAAGLGPAERVARVLSRPLQTVEASTPTYAAWQRLLDAGVHHLPVTKGGEIVGIVTSSDLLRSTAQGPVAVLRRVEHLPSREALPGYGAHVKEMTSALLAGGLDALVIAGFVSRLNDALVKRILSWAEEELGPPPAPYAWIVFGSEGRMEQTLLTDQDNAIVFADEGAAAARLVPGARRPGQPRPARGRVPRVPRAATWPAGGTVRSPSGRRDSPAGPTSRTRRRCSRPRSSSTSATSTERSTSPRSRRSSLRPGGRCPSSGSWRPPPSTSTRPRCCCSASRAGRRSST